MNQRTNDLANHIFEGILALQEEPYLLLKERDLYKKAILNILTHYLEYQYKNGYDDCLLDFKLID